MSNSGITVIIAGKDDTGAVFNAIEANMKRLQDRSHETESALGKLGEKATRTLEYIGISLAAREIIHGLEELIQKSMEFGEVIEKAAAKTGLSVGTLSTLHYAAQVTGSDFDGMTAAVSKMDKSIGAAADGDKKASAFLKGIGLDAKDLAGRADGAEIAFKKFTQTLAATESPARKNELAMGLLGKAGSAQIPMLIELGEHWDEMTQKAKDAGVYLDEKQAAILAETNQNLKDLQARVTGAGLAFTTGLSPGLSRFLSIIRGGKGDMDGFSEFGEIVAKGMNTAAAAVYGLASGIETLFAFSEGGVLTKVGARDVAASERFDAEANKFLDAAQPNRRGARATKYLGAKDIDVDADLSAYAGKKSRPSADGFDGIGDTEGASKIKDAKARRDAAALAAHEAEVRAKEAFTRQGIESDLAAIEAGHKAQLVSDEDYYKKRNELRLQDSNAQLDALLSQSAEITAAQNKIAALHVADGSAEQISNQAKMAELEAKRLELNTKIDKVIGDQNKAIVEGQADLNELPRKLQAQADAIAVAAEELHGGSTAARTKQSHDAYYGDGGERQRIQLNDPASLPSADSVQQGKEDTIAASGADQGYQRAAGVAGTKRASIDAQVARGTMTSVDAQRQKIDLDHQEATALEPVIAAYQKLADAGDLNAAEKVVELQEKLEELKNPVDEVAAHLRDELGSAFENLFENLDRGKKGFEDMAKQVERIFISEAYKKLIEPSVQSTLGRLIPNAKTPTAASAVGGLIPGLTSKLPGIGAKLTGGGAINVTLINQGTPMQVGSTSQQSSRDDEEESKIISIILKNLDQGGLIAQALGKI